MKICSECGSQNQDDTAYCKDCGKKLEQTIQKNKNLKNTNTKIIALLIGSIVLVILGLILSKDGMMYKYYMAKGDNEVIAWQAVGHYEEALKIDYNEEVLNKIEYKVLNSGTYSTELLKNLKNVLKKSDFNNLCAEVYSKEAEKAFEADDYKSCENYLKKAESYGYDVNDFVYLDELKEDKDDYSEEYDDDYIIADSDVRYLSRNELSKYTKTQLGYIRNEIFARHGYIFKNKEYSDYFGNKSWYVPDPDCSGTEADLNSVERANVELIQDMEEK